MTGVPSVYNLYTKTKTADTIGSQTARKMAHALKNAKKRLAIRGAVFSLLTSVTETESFWASTLISPESRESREASTLNLRLFWSRLSSVRFLTVSTICRHSTTPSSKCFISSTVKPNALRVAISLSLSASCSEKSKDFLPI